MELFKSRTRVVYTNAVGDKVYPVVVDIKKGIKSTEDIQFVSSDVNTGILSVAFIQGNDNYNVTGANVVCSVMRPDASTLELPCEVVRENIVEVPLGINGTSQDGVYSFDFKVLKGGNKVVGTPIMNYSVSLSIGNDMAVEEDDRLPILTMLITQVNELKEETSETINQANIATEASKEATANAIEATNNANAVSERVSQETATAISEIKQDTANAIASMNQNTTDAIADMTQKTNEAVIRVNDNLTNINNTVATKVAELDTAKSDMTTTVSNKIDEVENRFNALTSSQQQDAEVIDARDGETSLKARLDRDIEKAKQVYVNVEGSNISTDSSVGYLKDVEILGNTIQSASNLADIRSVGDKVEGQELYEIPVLSVGKNLLGHIENGGISTAGNEVASPTEVRSNFIKVKPNSKLFYSRNGVAKNTWWFCYDDSKNFISRNPIAPSFTVPSNCSYIRLLHSNAEIDNIQLEYDTRTPYEPYQEDKLTILSPTPLEKVGDVRDRIIEKDGVWGVEKNVHTEILGVDNSYNSTSSYVESGYRVVNISNLDYPCVPTKPTLMCNKLKYYINAPNSTECITSWSNAQGFIIKLSVNTIGEDSIPAIKEYIINNNFIVKYPLQTPTFIPLPHDQQVKLRTFANKTNISFLTEIEGTIKAQVPKSLGATVNTHTIQISNLNKELDRVKKLEESTVSTVITESDFTTVEATSNGYFEDVKLEGKTLVNLANNSNNIPNPNINQNVIHPRILDVRSKNYTLVIKLNTSKQLNCKYAYTDGTLGNDFKFCDANVNGVVTKLITPNMLPIDFDKEVNGFRLSVVGGTPLDVTIDYIELLEGDHTQNPPNGHIEGLKSVGQDVDEIVVSSVNENLFDVGSFVDFGLKQVGRFNFPINLEKNTTYTFSDDVGLWNASDVYIDLKNKDDILVCGLINPNLANRKQVTFTTDSVGGYYLETYANNIPRMLNITTNFMLNKGTTPKPYIPHQSDKKRLLYYNEETQTWEKPILREWDSIEKHSNGKYYYHQRSGEVVLNGSENWRVDIGVSFQVDTICFTYDDKTLLDTGVLNCTSIVDKFKVGGFNVTLNMKDCESYSTGWQQHFIKIQRSKLSTQDVEGFKQWLQANNVTVVYQLAEEKVYECTNIDLITYANETNYVVESGAIVPRSTLKVHNNISNVVSLLQKKVSLLESNVKASQEVQDMMILETDMRMLDIELALMEFAPMKLNLGGSDMLRSATYFNFLKNHIVNETYEKGYLENVMNKYLATGRINQDEYDELYNMLYPPVYDIELPIEP